jgi:hypothetical protein
MNLWSLEVELLPLRQRDTDNIDVKLKALLEQLLSCWRHGNEIVFCEHGRPKARELRVVINNNRNPRERSNRPLTACSCAWVDNAKQLRVMRQWCASKIGERHGMMLGSEFSNTGHGRVERNHVIAQPGAHTCRLCSLADWHLHLQVVKHSKLCLRCAPQYQGVEVSVSIWESVAEKAGCEQGLDTAARRFTVQHHSPASACPNVLMDHFEFSLT